ncbi:MAG TPA: hypothetical protein VEL76_06665 [Gemmataceae bacterium]|nr:hypothetical protein [Gemmataceae bacterium]
MGNRLGGGRGLLLDGLGRCPEQRVDHSRRARPRAAAVQFLFL